MHNPTCADMSAPLHRLVFQNLLLEADSVVVSSSQQAWALLLASAQNSTFLQAANPQLVQQLFNMACTPTGHVLNPKNMLSFPMAASSDGLLPSGTPSGPQKHTLGGEEGFDVARMRMAAAQALGQMANKFSPSGKAVMRSITMPHGRCKHT